MDFNGFSANGVHITVQHFPDRKKPYLCVRYDNDNTLYGVASFNSEDNAQRFLQAMLRLVAPHDHIPYDSGVDE